MAELDYTDRIRLVMDSTPAVLAACKRHGENLKAAWDLNGEGATLHIERV